MRDVRNLNNIEHRERNGKRRALSTTFGLHSWRFANERLCKLEGLVLTYRLNIFNSHFGTTEMGENRLSVVALRIIGDDLVPDEITALLGSSPTQACAKGETGKHIVGPKVGGVKLARSGMWTLQASDREPEDMNSQIREILSRVKNDFSVWQSITRRFRVDLFCGLWMSGSESGLTLSPESLAALGQRGIELAMCIYGDNDDESQVSD